jgi:hypothetical protein
MTCVDLVHVSHMPCTICATAEPYFYVIVYVYATSIIS